MITRQPKLRKRCARHSCWSCNRRGFTQIEVAMSALIAGIVLAAALNLSGYAARSNIANSDLLKSRTVASAMMAEILELPFKDPSGGSTIGPESGEITSPATRLLFDDVDDYHAWSSSPRTKSGAFIPDVSDLTVRVHVATANPDQLGGNGSGTASSKVKRITVTVTRGTATVSTLTGVVTE